MFAGRKKMFLKGVRYNAVQSWRTLPAFLLISGLWLISAAQDTIPARLIHETELSEWIENIAEEAEDELDYSELIENLNYLKQNPLNLNFATGDELRSLILLSDMQVYHLLAYRETYGYFVTMYELQTVEGFDQHTIQQILPYITISAVPPATKIPLKNALRYGENTLLIRFQQLTQEQQGFRTPDDSLLAVKPNSRYMGGPEKILARYRFRYGNKIRWGITAEKDAGEPFFKNRVNAHQRSLVEDRLPNGFDFYSFHLHFQDIGRIKSVAIGDYQLRFGQGLTMWNGLSFGKSGDAAAPNRHATGLRPYSSSDENRFFRGAAIAFNFGDFDFTGFFSDNKVDANVSVEDSISGQETITSFQESGFHRTPLELLKKNTARVSVMGGNLTFRKDRLKLGLTGFYTRLGANFQHGEALYQMWSFTGNENVNAGMDYGYVFHRMNVFGEISASRNGSVAQLHGLSTQLHPRITLSVLFRNYSPGFQNLYANGLSESNTVNEQGLYSGFRFLVRKFWTASGYLDLFSYPWLRYRVNKPSAGNDFFLQVDHHPSRQMSAIFRFRQKTKQINSSIEEIGVHPLMCTRKSSFRIHLAYAISGELNMANRMEYIIATNETGYRGTGYLVFHDIIYSPDQLPVRLFFRYALFDTDSYDERVYAYENDVLYAFSVPAYYYKGSKTVFMIRYEPVEKISLWFRVSHLFFSNKDQVGTGLDLIDGNHKTEVKVQLQMKL
jgi:hypothetical protein